MPPGGARPSPASGEGRTARAVGTAPRHAFGEWLAPAAWRAVDFISDLHLSEALPRTTEAFERYLGRTSADALMILGDLFELWVGDDALALPFATRCAAALREASRRLAVGIMVGNRDFLLGEAMLAACGARALPDPTLLVACGHRTLLSHGDAWCLADTAYQAYRGEVRSSAFQMTFLARPLAERLEIAAEIRAASETRRRFDGDLSADVDRVVALRALESCNAPALVHGHTHRPGSEPLGPVRWRHVLTDWDRDQGQRAEVLRLTPAGFARLAPERA